MKRKGSTTNSAYAPVPSRPCLCQVKDMEIICRKPCWSYASLPVHATKSLTKPSTTTDICGKSYVYEYVNVQIWAWKPWVWSILEVLLPKWLLYSNALHCTVCFGSTFTIASITIFSTTDQSKTRSLIELCLSTEGRVGNWISLNTCSKLFIPTFTLFLSYLNCYHGTHSCGCMSSTWRWWISNRNQPACKEGANRL